MAYYQRTFPPPPDSSLSETTSRRRTRRTELFLSLLLFIAFSFYFSSTLSGTDLRFLPAKRPHARNLISNVMKDDFQEVTRLSRHVSSVQDSAKYQSVSVLLPDWEVLVLLSPETSLDSVEGFYCLFWNSQTSPARFSGVLPFTERTAFKCAMPNGARRPPLWQPILTKYPEKENPAKERELLRMKKLAYESISTEDDVVLFVKGVNAGSRSRSPQPQDFMCVFGDAVKIPVTSCTQEVFRCSHPDLTAFTSGTDQPIKMSLQIMHQVQNRTLPSVAYYRPRQSHAQEPKSEICVCTMVYNVAKFVKEWVIYHTKIGVEKFILYDNGSEDDLQNVVSELNGDGYNVTTLLWIWPKTQEAGFSHNAIHAKHSCKWMLYIDVDEFVYSPSWRDSGPSKHLLKALIPQLPSIGQVSIRCLDFGPSGQKSHPIEGVTQGYNCQRWDVSQQRHKSMVLLEAIDDSLGNVVHHFRLKNTFQWRELSMSSALVNHYKYQAWSEFKTKFRRRVSAYVADWRDATNPNSKDRTPGLGFEPIKPQGWEFEFCNFTDDRLKLLTQRWFGQLTPNGGYKMAWQR
ncbi:hypothetical protein CUMW_278780 [Citrus unshiu]|uniref:Glycosyltransferase family 92 protein n=1 Tax=Citrus unshiu TaxID=55188 RepID=A0A2H5N6S1_CITUN|nr:hypothetical protein CUMW_278780 [Citrus unshiu]